MVALGIIAAAVFGGGASLLSGNQKKRAVNNLERELKTATGDPYKYSLTRYRLDGARLDKAASTPRSGVLHFLTFGLSTSLGNNKEKAEQGKISAEVMQMLTPDLTDKGSLYYLLFKEMDPGTGTKTRTDVAMFLAKQPPEVKVEMTDLLTKGRPQTDAEHGSFFSTLKELGENRVEVARGQYKNAREFMLSCLKGEQPLAAGKTPAAAVPVRTAAVGSEPLPHVRRERVKTADTREKTGRYGSYSPHSSWYRDMTTAASF